MANDYFEFKQFKILQDKTAMKVGTDGVLLGAWAELYAEDNILDIGTGTGLIALMLAQRSKGEIVGVELDNDASFQADQNCENSIWSERIKIINDSIQNYVNYANRKFDLIVSNPPFFTEGVRPKIEKRAIARHSDSLNLQDLVCCATRLLTPNGRIALILPYEMRLKFIQEITQNNLWLRKELFVKPNEKKDYTRIMFEAGFKQPAIIERGKMAISESEKNQYTTDFENLTRDYYLFL